MRAEVALIGTSGRIARHSAAPDTGVIEVWYGGWD